MKPSNLAWRMEPPETPERSADRPPEPSRQPDAQARNRMRARSGFERRTIEIRDQGFGPFRVR